MQSENGGPWTKIVDLIRVTPGPMVCLGKGNVASVLVGEWTSRTLVADRDFSSFFIDGEGIMRETWGSYLAPFHENKLIADFETVEFREGSLGLIFVPELSLMKKEEGLNLLSRSKRWVREGGVIVVWAFSFQDVRYKNFRAFGRFFAQESGPYVYKESEPGSIKVDPPLPCSQGCSHEYFAFFNPFEIRQIFFGRFEEIIAKEFSDLVDGNHFAFFIYVIQKVRR